MLKACDSYRRLELFEKVRNEKHVARFRLLLIMTWWNYDSVVEKIRLARSRFCKLSTASRSRSQVKIVLIYLQSLFFIMNVIFTRSYAVDGINTTVISSAVNHEKHSRSCDSFKLQHVHVVHISLSFSLFITTNHDYKSVYSDTCHDNTLISSPRIIVRLRVARFKLQQKAIGLQSKCRGQIVC